MPKEDAVDLELWLENGSGQPLTGLRTQICAMLKGMPGFNAQTKDNKRFDGSVASTRMDSGEREILIAFDRCGRVWGNEKCPCMHSDPVLPDAAPGQRVSVKGRLWFLDAIANRDKEVRRAQREFAALERPPVK